MNPLQDAFFEHCDRIDKRYQSAIIITVTALHAFGNVENGYILSKVIIEQTAKLVDEDPNKLVSDANKVINGFLEGKKNV